MVMSPGADASLVQELKDAFSASDMDEAVKAVSVRVLECVSEFLGHIRARNARPSMRAARGCQREDVRRRGAHALQSSEPCSGVARSSS
jgi:hypothetical protein